MRIATLCLEYFEGVHGQRRQRHAKPAMNAGSSLCFQDSRDVSGQLGEETAGATLKKHTLAHAQELQHELAHALSRALRLTVHSTQWAHGCGQPLDLAKNVGRTVAPDSNARPSPRVC